MLSRNHLGQFEKGVSGNPKGRPRKVRPRVCDFQLREDLFEAVETLVPIIEGGKRKLIPARVAIDKQLVLKAASGDMKAICKYNKRRDRFVLEHVKKQLDMLGLMMDGEDRIRMYPEDVTDEFKHIIHRLRLVIDPDYLP
jgi:Family of unknown function (DUF5681)